MTRSPDVRPVALCPAADLRSTISDLAGKPVTLMGLGLFGGGEGAARFLLGRGARLTITDLRPAEKLAPTLSRLKGLPITYRLGGHATQDFTDAELVVANPAVPRTSMFLKAAADRGVPITSPMNIFLARCPAPVAAVTGSNGKSTTTALLAAMLTSAGRRVWLGGNIGISLLPSLGEVSPSDIVVVELSSFQLEDATALSWSPHVALVTNVTPDHLDRHESLEAYAAAKRTILAHQGAGDFAVLNARDPILQRWVSDGVPGRLVLFDSAPKPGGLAHGVSLLRDRLVWRNGTRDEVICLRDDVPLLGLHNAENAMAAAAAARCLGAQAGAIFDALSSFVGLEHRLELVGEFHGIRFYNDSYSTTPASGVAAVQSFRGPVTLIAGGYDKKLDMTPLARAVASRVEVLVTIGHTGPTLAEQARRESLYLGRSLVIREAGSLEEAVRVADGLSMPGSAVVFSPGCASYDMFDNYDQRGKVFKGLVRTTMRRSG